MMRKEYRLLTVIIVLLLLVSTVACDVASSGGLIGELLEDHGKQTQSQDRDDQDQDDERTTKHDNSVDLGTEIETDTSRGTSGGWWPFGTTEQVTEQATEQATEPPVEETPWFSQELDPAFDLDGKEVVILSQRMQDVGPEESYSDLLENAVYNRNNMIMSRFGAVINGIVVEDYVSLGENVKNDVIAGAGEYHIVYQHMVNSATNLALTGCLHDLTELNYVNFDQPWWDRDCKNDFMIGDTMLMASGYLLPSSMLLSSAMLFNKNLLDERGLEYPYQDVREGTWTLDDMLYMTKDQTQDLNGDGIISYTDDFYGLTGWALDCDAGFADGAGMTMFVYDDNHLPVYQPDPDRLQAVYEKIYELLITQNSFHVTVSEYINNPDMYAEPGNVFKASRALFFAGYLSGASGLRDMEADWGILPMPKYDEKQEEYRSSVNGSASAVIVPASLYGEKLEDVGYMLELLASSSYYTVSESLYDTVAKHKISHDPESLEMVDIIWYNRVFDFGYIHFYLEGYGCVNVVQTALQEKNPSIHKNITRNEKSIIKHLQKVLQVYSDLYGE